MRYYQVNTIDDFYTVLEKLEDASPGDVIEAKGRISQNISKAFNAYHKTLGGRAKARMAISASLGALCFGPVGWLVSGAATAGVFASSRQLKELKSSFRALPCAAEIEDIALAGFELANNDGESVTLRKAGLSGANR